MTREDFRTVEVGDNVLLIEPHGDGDCAEWQTKAIIVRKHLMTASLQIGEKVVVRNIKQLKKH